MEDLLQEYPVVIEMPVSWGDMDALQHVNHAVYFRYFLNGRVAYLEKLGALKLMEQAGVGFILASILCRFKIPLTYPDRILVGTRVVSIDDDRFTIQQAIYSHEHGKIATEVEAILVTYDYRNNRKIAVPTELKKRIEDLERNKE